MEEVSTTRLLRYETYQSKPQMITTAGNCIYDEGCRTQLRLIEPGRSGVDAIKFMIANPNDPAINQ